MSTKLSQTNPATGLAADDLVPIVQETGVGVTGYEVKRITYTDLLSELGEDVPFNAQGAGAEERTVQSKLRDAVSVKDFGATGDGVTDDNTGVETAAAQDGVAFVPAGTYSVTSVNNGSGVGVALEGQGTDSVLEKEPAGTVGPNYMFQGQIKLLLRKLSLLVKIDPVAVNGTNLFAWNHDNIDIIEVESDGEVEIDGAGDRNGLANLTTVSSSATSRNGLRILFSKFRRYFWGILKANTTVSAENDVTIAFSEFDEFGAVQILFNSPAVGASNENILVIGNKLGSVLSQQPFGSVIGYPHRTSFAGHVEYVRFMANHATGYGGEVFRSEEAAHAIICLGNTAKLNGKDGIEIIPNNISGGFLNPTMHIVSNNVIENVGLEAAPTLGWGVAFHSYPSVVGYGPSATESTMHDNVSSGWEYAYSLHWGAHRNLVHHNIAHDSAEGLRLYQPSPGMQDNLVIDCPIAVHVLGDTNGIGEGGLLGNTHYRSTANPPEPMVIDADMPLGMLGWTFETGCFDIANGATAWDIITLGDRMDGEVVIAVTRSGVNYNYIKGTITYDGATLTFTETLRHDSGNVAVSLTALTAVGGMMQLNLFNAAGAVRSNYRVAVCFKGLHLFGVP